MSTQFLSFLTVTLNFIIGKSREEKIQPNISRQHSITLPHIRSFCSENLRLRQKCTDLEANNNIISTSLQFTPQRIREGLTKLGNLFYTKFFGNGFEQISFTNGNKRVQKTQFVIMTPDFYISCIFSSVKQLIVFQSSFASPKQLS